MSGRRLPVYILLDTSGSMHGEPIHAVNVGLRVLVDALRQDPYALESVYLSVLTFDLEVLELFPLTPLDQVKLPQLATPDSGPTFLGAALALLHERVVQAVLPNTPTQKGDWRPLLFLMTDGAPSDLALYREMIPQIQQLNFANIVACAAGPKARIALLQELTPQVVSLDITDSAAFSQFFKWVSLNVASGSSSAGVGAPPNLPPPPPELQVVI